MSVGSTSDGYAYHQTISDLLYLMLFLLFWTGKYGKEDKDTRLDHFRLADIHFFINYLHLISSDTPLSNLRWATFVALALNDQKNSVCGESIRHVRSDHQHACAV